MCRPFSAKQILYSRFPCFRGLLLVVRRCPSLAGEALQEDDLGSREELWGSRRRQRGPGAKG
eukprot:5200301-Alexandrium_andersonii.AAC.1